MIERLFQLGCMMIAGSVLVSGTPALAATDEKEEVVWKETTRDVYVDGRLDPGIVVVRASDPPRMAILRNRDDQNPIVIVTEIDEATGDAKGLTVSRMAVASSALGERGWEVTAKGELREFSRASARNIGDSTVLLNLPDSHLIVARHAGVRGATSSDDVFSAVPTWKALHDRYEPDATALQALTEFDDDVKLTLAMGTWCGDSKRAVPRLIKAVEAAGNDRIQLEIVGLSGDFDEPGEFVRKHKLTNVPTLVVSRGGEEIGRVVETPAGESMTHDLARILSRQPVVHKGRWSRTDKLARGRYAVLDASGNKIGIEDWELFADEDGGTLLHAWKDQDGKPTEIWHRRDGEGRSAFIEVTRNHDRWHSRSRHWIAPSKDPDAPGLGFRSTTRGNGTGVIRHNTVLDESAVVVSPCSADVGLAASRAAAPHSRQARDAMILGGSGEAPSGRLSHVELAHRGIEPATTPAGSFQAHRIAGRFDGQFVDGWLHAELNVPVRLRTPGGGEVILTELETFEVPEPAPSEIAQSE